MDEKEKGLMERITTAEAIVAKELERIQNLAAENHETESDEPLEEHRKVWDGMQFSYGDIYGVKNTLYAYWRRKSFLLFLNCYTDRRARNSPKHIFRWEISRLCYRKSLMSEHKSLTFLILKDCNFIWSKCHLKEILMCKWMREVQSPRADIMSVAFASRAVFH